jgi:hypothetical protein
LQWPAWPAAVVAQGGSDAGSSGKAQDGQGEVAQGGHDTWAAAGPDLGEVFAPGDVADPVQTVLDCPVAAQRFGQLIWPGLRGGQRGDGVYSLAGPLRAAQRPAAADGLGGVREGQPGSCAGDLEGAPLVPAMAAVAGAAGDRDVAPGQACELGAQFRLVALDVRM